MIVPILRRWSTHLWSWWRIERIPYLPREIVIYAITLLRDGPLVCLGSGGMATTENAT